MTDLIDLDTICGGINGLGYYLWQIQWTGILIVADLMDWDTICGRFNELVY